MKKNLLLFTFLAFTLIGVYAQTTGITGYWDLQGNTDTEGRCFIGTTDKQPLIFKTRETERMKLLNDRSFLGVGISTPLASLHLHYQTDDQPKPLLNLLQLTTDATGNGPTNGFSITYEPTNDIRFKQQESAKFFIEGPGGGFVVAQDGNIGYGTDVPEEKIHLQGTLLIENTASTQSSLQFKHPDTKGLPPDDPQAITAPHFWDIYSDISGLKFNTVHNDGTVALERVIISKGGSVGIGVAKPLARLHVGHNILADGNIYTKGDFVLAPDSLSTGNWLMSRSGNGLNYIFEDKTNQNALFLGNNGNVGVGTTIGTTGSLTAKLEVNGSLKATSANIDGTLTANELNAQNATINGNLEALSANIPTLTTNSLNILGSLNNLSVNALTAQTATITGISNLNGNVTVGTAPQPANLNVIGALSAKSANITGNTTIKEGVFNLSLGSAYSQNLSYGTSYIGFNATRNNGNWAFVGDGANNGGAVIWNTVSGTINFASIPSTGIGAKTLTDTDIKNNIKLQLTSAGVLKAKEVQVSLSGWPDYVFGKDYKLPTLNEVEQFITENNHLPNVPSAAEVEANGIQLGEMNAILIQKVEELTLYIIEQEKLMKKMENRISELESKKGGE